MVRLLLAILVLLACNLPSKAFLSSCGSIIGTIKDLSSQQATESNLSALTERQMQFWEDVDEGLDDIENFYAKKGESIDRIRVFSKT